MQQHKLPSNYILLFLNVHTYLYIYFNIPLYLFYRTSAKYRYRFVCRKRSEKLRSSAASNHSKAEPNKPKNCQNGSAVVVGESNHQDDEKQALIPPKPCGHCRNKEIRYKIHGSIPIAESIPITNGRCVLTKKGSRKFSSGNGKTQSASPATTTTRQARKFFAKNSRKQPVKTQKTTESILQPDDLPPFDGFCCGHSYFKYSDINGCTCRCDQCLTLNCEKLSNPVSKKSFQVKFPAKSDGGKESKLDFDEKSDKNDETKQESVGGGGCSASSLSNSKNNNGANGSAVMPSAAGAGPGGPAGPSAQPQTNGGCTVASDNKVSFFYILFTYY